MRKIRVGIVGPADSVSLTYQVSLERTDILDPVPIVYQDASEVPQIVTDRDEEMDMWLFSGIVPYRYALPLGAGAPLFYLPHTGSSLYRVLFEMTYIQKLPLQGISFDTFSSGEVEETFSDIELPQPKIFVNYYEGIVSAKELTDYHYDLWRSGQTNIAVTCFFATYQNLRKMGVPAFRIWPTRSTVRTTLDIAINSLQAKRYKGGQLAIQEVLIDDYEDLIRNSSSYQAKKIELRLYEILVSYAEQLKGSIVIRGDGQYTLYSTRGILEELTEEFTVIPILEAIIRNVPTKVSGGIGYGSTAYEAEQNAFQALGLARQKGKGLWMAVTDEREVIGPLSSAIRLKYSMRADGSGARELAEQLNISIATLNKLMAAVDKLDKETICADDLAMYLAITPRSARRLLSAFVEQDFAEDAGEEMLAKGRPRKLYKMLLPKLLKYLE